MVKPFELVMSLITGLGDKTVDSISDLHRYFTGLTYTDVQYKPLHNQLNKPEFLDLMKQLVGMDMGSWQLPQHAYKRATQEHIAIPNILDRQFAVTAPNQAWCGDVSFIYTPI